MNRNPIIRRVKAHACFTNCNNNICFSKCKSNFDLVTVLNLAMSIVCLSVALRKLFKINGPL